MQRFGKQEALSTEAVSGLHSMHVICAVILLALEKLRKRRPRRRSVSLLMKCLGCCQEKKTECSNFPLVNGSKERAGRCFLPPKGLVECPYKVGENVCGLRQNTRYMSPVRKLEGQEWGAVGEKGGISSSF